MALVLKKFGIIAFITGLLGFTLALYLGQGLDFATQELVGWAVMGMTMALVYFGIAYQRDTVNAGRLTFKQAIKTGLIIALMGALGIALADVLYTVFVNPAFFEQYNTYAMELAQESGNAETVESLKAQKEMLKDFSPIQVSLLAGLMMLVMTFVLGAGVTLLSSFILRKK